MMFRTVLFLISILFVSQAFAGAIVTYHGRISKPDETPLEGVSVSFKIQVRSPGASSCLLYEETRTVNMAGSKGFFVIPIGDGNGSRTVSDPAIPINNVFSNNTALNFTGLACNAGSAYQPTSLDSRRLVVTFDDGSGAGPQILAPMDINYVPLALHTLEAQTALSVGSTPAANVMTVSGPASALTPSNFTELLALVNGTSTTYAKISSSVGGDLSGTIASANVIKLQGRAVSSSAPSTSDVLTWNGSAWVPAAGGGGGAVSSVAGRTGAVVLANTDISGLGDSSTKNVGTAAGTVAAGDDARFGTASVFTGSFTGDVTGTQSATVVSAVGGSTAANVHNADLLANSATSANTVSTIVRRDASGDFISRDASLRSVILRDSGSKNITMVAPATLTNSYTLTWPLDKGTNNQVLTTDASGNLSWGTPAGAGVSTVTSGGAPIVIGGTGSTPTVSVDAATTSASGVVTLSADNATVASTVVQATDSRLTNARAPSGSAGGDLGSTYPNPTVTGIKGAAITYTALTTGDFLKYNGTAWVNTALSSANLSNDSNLLKASNMPANCSASQALTFSSPTGTWVCSNIAGLDAGVITTGTIADNRLPASATYWQAATGGINYAGGSVGIGTTDPTVALDVAGAIRPGSSTAVTTCGLGQANGEGSQRYNYTSHAMEYCNGTTWVAGGGAAVTPTKQTMDASGTWTKPSTGTFAKIECWGGGGGGAHYNQSDTYGSGGGGGAYMVKEVLLTSLSATVTVTIGAGGAGQAGNASGGNGGNTTFGAYLTAYGGGGGAAGYGSPGGGGGPLSAGTQGGAAGLPSTTTPFHGGNGSAGGSTYGGAGGASSMFAQATSGGQSVFGGNGGGTSAAGTVPGGGGGGSSNAVASGAGASGRCTITTW